MPMILRKTNFYTAVRRYLYSVFIIMRARAIVERRTRHRSNRPTHRIENEYNPEAMPQYFQVSVNVLEAKKLVWSNTLYANSYVIIVLGKKKHRTSIRRSMEEPYYREYFVFELYMSIRDIQRSSLWLAVMEPRFCAPPRLLGEATIDLGAIWAQPHHQVYHKWAQLSLPRDPSAGPVGFLKVDISIIFRGEVQVMPITVSNEKLEDNLLLPTGSEQQRANYLVTIYGAFGLPNGTQQCHGHEKRFGKPPSTFARVSFCGLVAKTAVQLRNNDPMYCEQVSIVEMFPNMNQTIRLEVCSAEGVFNRVLATTELRLGQISHDGENGFLPTFGPSLLHMYGTSCTGTLGTTGEDGPYHRGALLVSLKTIVPYYQQVLRSVNVEPVTPIKPDKLWLQEDFCVFCPVMEVSMLDRRVSGKLCGVAITIGEIPSEEKSDEEFEAMVSELKENKLHYTGSLDVIKSQTTYGYLHFANAFPVLQLATRLPDFRFRMYRNNMVYGIVADLEQSLADVERRLQNFEYASTEELVDELNKALDDASGNILKFLDIISHASSVEDASQQCSTELDQKQLDLQKEELEGIHKRMSNRARTSSWNLIQDISKIKLNSSRKGVKLLLADTKAFAQNLKNVIYNTSDGWPNIVIWLLNNGSRVAYSKISTADIIYSVIPEQCGRNCGRIQTLYLKALKCPKHMNTLASGCFCIAGKVELLLWMGTYRQKNAFVNCLPTGFHLRVKDYDMCIRTQTMMIECRAFVYRAKLNDPSGIDNSHAMNPFVRINVLNIAKETKVKQKTFTPIWNQLLKVQKMVFMSVDRLVNSPPIILVEIYDSGLAGKSELIGRFQTQPVVDDRQSFDYAPKLQWYDIYKGVENTGQVLMSVQLLQIPEKLLKTTVYSPIEEYFYASTIRDTDPLTDDYEPLPNNLVPQSSTYKMDVYWWGLRDVNITRKPCVILELDELTVKSDVIADKKTNSNFPNGRTTQIFESSLNEIYSPSLSIRLYDSSTFGRTLFLGTNVIKNPNKYMIHWLSKSERESSLKSFSLTSSQFCQVTVNQVVVISNGCKTLEDNEDLVSIVSRRNSVVQTKVKRSKWRKLLMKEPDEEEYVLLPVLNTDNDQIKVKRTHLNINESSNCKNWWLKFYCSEQVQLEDNVDANDEDNIGSITIYDSELEHQPQFSKFKDWCTTLKLYNGKKTGIPEKDEQLQCGYLKAGIAIYKWPPPENIVAVSLHGVDLNKGYFNDYPSNHLRKFLVRVYVIRGIKLMAKDFTGKSDPYVLISCGKKHLGDRNNYIPNTVDPIFGKMFEFRCILPEDYQMTLSLYDFDAVPPDELIGSTSIDLEDRIYTKHRASVGLSTEYNMTGPAKWRDCWKPSEILEELCAKNHISAPMFPDANSVVLNGVEYRDNLPGKNYAIAAERKENICLSLLQMWHTIPLCGYHLVPEHVETRTLYNPDKPGIEQGKVQLWVDIFPLGTGTGCFTPPPIEIDAQKTEEYELRVIVWNAKVEINKISHSGKYWKALDCYVKCWIGSPENAQCTDVHYNCVNGESNFNWRMVFRFMYQHAREKLVQREKGPFTECEEYSSPFVMFQVLENDADEFLGALTLNLNSVPRGMPILECSATECNRRKLNMFSAKSTRACWPLVTIDLSTGNSIPVGAMEVELIVLPIEQAKIRPVGLGREPPMPLPVPRRNAHATNNCMKKLIESMKRVLMDKCMLLILCVITLTTLATIGYLFLLTYWFRNSSHSGHHKHAKGIIRKMHPIPIRIPRPR